jgi:hypothetical protein
MSELLLLAPLPSQVIERILGLVKLKKQDITKYVSYLLLKTHQYYNIMTNIDRL